MKYPSRLQSAEERFCSVEATDRALHFLDIVGLLDAGKLGPGAVLNRGSNALANLVEVQEVSEKDLSSATSEALSASSTETSAVLAGVRELAARLQAFEMRIASPPPTNLVAGDVAPASVGRPIGHVRSFLEDVRARGFEPRGLLDVGANRGDWTRMACGVFPSMPYILVEPQREMMDALKSLANRAGCHFFNAGAGATSGELVQTIWPDLGGSSFLPPPDETALRDGRQRRTKIVTLDSILQGPCSRFSPDLVKLDIQGFELEALSGGESLFGRTELFIMEMALFEFMPHQPLVRDVINFMGERSYELYDITEFGRRPHDGALGQVDLAFVKANGMFRKSVAW